MRSSARVSAARSSYLLLTPSSVTRDGVPAFASYDSGTSSLEIVETEPVVKGQTASGSYKPAKLSNGIRVMVPPHIESGTRIVVDVYERTYVRKAD